MWETLRLTCTFSSVIYSAATERQPFKDAALLLLHWTLAFFLVFTRSRSPALVCYIFQGGNSSSDHQKWCNKSPKHTTRRQAGLQREADRRQAQARFKSQAKAKHAGGDTHTPWGPCALCHVGGCKTHCLESDGCSDCGDKTPGWGAETGRTSGGEHLRAAPCQYREQHPTRGADSHRIWCGNPVKMNIDGQLREMVSCRSFCWKGLDARFLMF